MTDDATGAGPGPGADGAAGTEDTDEESLSTPRARAPWERKDPNQADEVKHSALVGFMSVPISRRFPIRRSTFVMALAFVGLATLLYFNPPQSTATGGVVLHTSQGDVFVPNATPVSTTTTTTTVPPTTTTSTTTSVFSPTTTTSPNTSSASTSTSTSTTTTVSGGGGSGTTGTANTSPGTSGFGTAGTTTTSVAR